MKNSVRVPVEGNIPPFQSLGCIYQQLTQQLPRGVSYLLRPPISPTNAVKAAWRCWDGWAALTDADNISAHPLRNL